MPIAGFHLHFYQPPRENPWLGVVPNEWGAWPYHDWNERITAECYRAMIAVALPHGDDGGTELNEPLAKSSFDVGPTLHHWIDRYAPDVDRALAYQVSHVAASPRSVVVAAPYVHAIVPLARATDRERLVAWGIADYQRRFGERPLGMWLPETAVDLDTLETLARQGIRYTILMPGQAARIREPGGAWQQVDVHSLDTSRPYLVRLSEGRTITVVFGHGDLSQRVAFGDLVNNGTKLADTMMESLDVGNDGLVLLVTDGETFGHHHRFGDLGLAWAMRRLQRHYGVDTTLGEWLATQEPTFEVELAPVSSWSCAHGVERWRSDCGCVTGSQPGWRQDWRTPLREALDWLRDTLGNAVDVELVTFVKSPDETLRDYGTVLTGALGPAEFVRAHQARALDDDETTKVLELCEIYRNLQFSFTSCAWFFADPAEIETAIVLRYAAVALELAVRTLGLGLEAEFLTRLQGVRSNRPGVDGREIWRQAREHYRFDEALIVAGFAAEHLANENGARHDRGFWRLEIQPPLEDDEAGTLRVTLTNTPTLRRQTFLTRAQRSGALGVRVQVRADGAQEWLAFGLGELGTDAVALVASSWLVGPGSMDFEGALNLLVAEMLMRHSSTDDAVVLVALAGAPRCVTPAGEASIRRALLAITAQPHEIVDVELLAPLARAVGLAELVGSSRPLAAGG
jgi:alpha-amylase/alpha-mannosidase (GH57 family)